MRGSAAFAVLAAVAAALPLLTFAAPPQPTAAGVILPSGTIETIVLDQPIDSATAQPGAAIPAHLRGPIELRGKTLAPSGASLRVVVTETRRAGAGAEGALFLRVESVPLSGAPPLPLRLLHPYLTPPLVAANPKDIVLPNNAKPQPKAGQDLVLPRGTMLAARTTATLDATQADGVRLMTPAPYTLSTDAPYSAFTPIPLATLDPNRPSAPPGRGRGRRGRPTPSPSPSPSPTESISPSPNPT